MHMADALLSPGVGVTMCAVSTAAIAISAAKLKKDELEEKKIPLMGVMGSFVFAAQMINFTIPATGSSGHIGGGILLAALLGPFGGFLTIAAVLLIQCLFFADGGLLALGCNLFNMGAIPCFLVYPLVFRPFLEKNLTAKRITIAAVLSGILALQLGAFSVVVQTLASGIAELPFSAFLALMQPIHLAIGIVEGLVTAAVLNYVKQMRPELLRNALRREKLGAVSLKKLLLVFVALAVFIAGAFSFYASSYPDGLEWSILGVAGTTELDANGGLFSLAARIQEAIAFMPDYDFKNVEAKGLLPGTSSAGIIGGLMTFLLAATTGLVISLLKRKREAERN
ncbi:MAG: energy-coupling factor ABC transporter permease [Syntrophomonadaceae bacterium]|nr:energy-coupling factor ABC transporter permease [Syntrophomonadaceae bacterium]